MYQFGDKLAFLDKNDGEFITPNNYDDYKEIINEVFDELSDDLVKYKLNYSVGSNFYHVFLLSSFIGNLDKVSLHA